jgi:hypothetical protein
MRSKYGQDNYMTGLGRLDWVGGGYDHWWAFVHMVMNTVIQQKSGGIDSWDLRLFNCTEWDVQVIMNCEHIRNSKEAVTAYFKVIYRNSCGVTEESHDMFNSSSR